MTDPYNNLEEANKAYHRARLLEEAGELESALKIRKRLAEALPTSKKNLTALGNLYQRLGKLELAETAYRNVVKHHPKFELASLNLFHLLWDGGNVLWDHNRRSEAMEELRRFQTVSHSDDYMEIVREINEKSDDDFEEDTNSK